MNDIEAGIVFFPTQDLEATTRFYRDTLGLSLALDQGRCRIFRVTSTTFLGFCLRHAPSSADGVIVTLVTEDVEGWFTDLRKRGAAIEKAPVHNATYHITHGFLRDPNGYVVEIQRFDDPAWNGTVGQREIP